METTINRGGIAEIGVILMSNTSGLKMFDENTAYKPTANTGLSFEDLEFTEIKKFEHPAVIGNSGRIVNFLATIIHSGYSLEKDIILNALRDRTLFVYYRTLNDQKMLVENALLSFSKTQDPSTGTVTGYEITLKADLNHDVFYCTGTEVVKVSDGPILYDEFNGGSAGLEWVVSSYYKNQSFASNVGLTFVTDSILILAITNGAKWISIRPKIGIDIHDKDLTGKQLSFSCKLTEYDTANCHFNVSLFCVDANGNETGLTCITLEGNGADYPYIKLLDAIPNDAVTAYIQLDLVWNWTTTTEEPTGHAKLDFVKLELLS
jgi:hypothetical protein